MAGSNRLIIVANKADLLSEGTKVKSHARLFSFSARSSDKKEKEALIDFILARTTKRPARALLLGYPNIGKSTLINSLSGRHAARVSPIAGTTKDVQWVNINKDLTITDYRGIFPPGEKRHDLIRKGAVNLHGDEDEHIYVIVKKILASPGLRKWIEKKYDFKIGEVNAPDRLLELLAERRKWYLKGGVLNIQEASRNLMRAMKEAPEI
jgi:ribosome biogenesis GTPase A